MGMASEPARLICAQQRAMCGLIPTKVVVCYALKRSLRQRRPRGMVGRQRFQRKRTPGRTCSGPPSDIDKRFTPFAMRASQYPSLDGAAPHVERAAASALVPHRALWESDDLRTVRAEHPLVVALCLVHRVDSVGAHRRVWNNYRTQQPAPKSSAARYGAHRSHHVCRSSARTRTNTSLQFIKRRVQIPNLVSSSLERGNCARYCIDVNAQGVSAQPLRFDD